MPKMEVEFTEKQLEKVEILKSKDVSVGQAIDLLFGLQNEVIYLIEEQEQEENLLEKLIDTGFDSQIKQELLKRNYDDEETYDRKVQNAKQGIKWSKFLKF